MTYTDPTDLRTGHVVRDSQVVRAGADHNSPPAKGSSETSDAAPVEPTVPDSQNTCDTPVGTAVGDPSTRTGHRARDAQTTVAGAGPDMPGGQWRCDAQREVAVGQQTPQPTTPGSTTRPPTLAGLLDSGDQGRRDLQGSIVAAPTPPAPANPRAASTVGSLVLADPDGPGPATGAASSNQAAPVLADPLLALAADVIDDLERVRIANENRLRQLTRDETDRDGEERGFGLDERHPDVARLAALVDALAKAEHDATLQVQRQLRKHPLGPWVKAQRGVGEKQAARLLAAIGDPYWNDLHQRPRALSELRSYCGYGDADKQVRRRGERANWSTTAKMRAWNISDKCIQTWVDKDTCPRGDDGYAEHGEGCSCSPYRRLYDRERRKYDGAVHHKPCVRCGPSGHPAPAGSPLSAGHQKACAVRRMSKELLGDLWREAKRLHDEAAGAAE